MRNRSDPPRSGVRVLPISRCGLPRVAEIAAPDRQLVAEPRVAVAAEHDPLHAVARVIGRTGPGTHDGENQVDALLLNHAADDAAERRVRALVRGRNGGCNSALAAALPATDRRRVVLLRQKAVDGRVQTS